MLGAERDGAPDRSGPSPDRSHGRFGPCLGCFGGRGRRRVHLRCVRLGRIHLPIVTSACQPNAKGRGRALRRTTTATTTTTLITFLEMPNLFLVVLRNAPVCPLVTLTPLSLYPLFLGFRGGFRCPAPPVRPALRPKALSTRSTSLNLNCKEVCRRWYRYSPRARIRLRCRPKRSQAPREEDFSMRRRRTVYRISRASSFTARGLTPFNSPYKLYREAILWERESCYM